jgi:ParB/RepB/Spo0J family partition protein
MATEAKKAEITVEEFRRIALDAIVSSKTNPRRVVGDLADLIPSVRKKGVLEPIKVRPLDGEKFEIVFGERRVAAARKVGLKDVPAIVRSMTDAEALEEQIIENRDRQDVHPLDEAEAYDALLKAKGAETTVEDVAARCGIDAGKVYRRLALLSLSKGARLAFREGRLEASVAGLIARIKGSNLQDRATEELAAMSDGSRGPVPYRTALDHIRRVYMLRLADASFDVKDAKLVEGAGACASCPKNTNSSLSFFGDISDRDALCTDPACHAKKTDAAWTKKAEEAKKAGKAVLDVRACREIFKYGATEPSTESGFVRLDSPCPDDPKGRTYRQILGSKLPEITLGRDEFGTSHDLADRKATRRMVVEALPAAQRAAIEGKDADEAALAKAERDEEERRDVLSACLDLLREEIPAKGEILPAALRVLALGLTETGARLTRAAWHIDGEDAERVKRIGKATGAELGGVVVMAAIEKFEAGPFARGEESEPFLALLKAYGVDVKKVRDEVRAAAKGKGEGEKKGGGKS